MAAPQAICPDIFLAGVTVRLKLITRRLNMRILRSRLACTVVYVERTYKSGSVSKTKGMRSHYYAFRIIYIIIV